MTNATAGIKKIFLNCGLLFFQSGINVHNHLKKQKMKFVKFSVFALTMGLFVASCGGGGETKTTDSTASATTTTMQAAPAPAPATADTMTAGAAKPADTAKPAAAPEKK